MAKRVNTNRSKLTDSFKSKFKLKGFDPSPKVSGEGHYMSPAALEYFVDNVVAQPDGSFKFKKSAIDGTKPKAPPTDAQIRAAIAARFSRLEKLCDAAMKGSSAFRALMITGAPGLGKSYTVEEKLEAHYGKNTKEGIIKGFVRATGLFKLLWKHRRPTDILTFDDSDSILKDEVCLNLLKAACDTTERRVISWASETQFFGAGGVGDVEDGDDENEGGAKAEAIPTSFEFEGTIIIISNLDIHGMVDDDTTLSPHLDAIRSRAHVLDMGMRDPREKMARIRMIADEGTFLKHFKEKQREEIFSFMEKNILNFRRLDVRTAVKIGGLYEEFPSEWKEMTADAEFQTEV